MKARNGKSFSLAKKLGLPMVFLFCSIFFLSGFFGSILLSSEDGSGIGSRGRSRILESVMNEEEEEDREYEPIRFGESGDGFVASIPNQVLSWKPRAVYFPRFAIAIYRRSQLHRYVK